MIELQGRRKTYRGRRGDTEAVRDVDLVLRDGSITALVGPERLREVDAAARDRGVVSGPGCRARSCAPTEAGDRPAPMAASSCWWTSRKRQSSFSGAVECVDQRCDAAASSTAWGPLFHERHAGEVLGQCQPRRLRRTAIRPELSGGMAQAHRRSRACLIHRDRRAFLLDEPFAALDPALQGRRCTGCAASTCGPRERQDDRVRHPRS